MAMLERRPKDDREGSNSESSVYAASTSSSIENINTNLTQQIDQFAYKKKSNYNSNMVEISSDQLPQQGYESMTRVPHRFYRQVRYDDQLQAYVIIDTIVLVLAETSMYIIFHEPTKRNFTYNPEIRQFRQIRVEECDWTTRYLLCQDVIFHEMTDQTNYDRQGRNEQTPGKQINDLWFQAPDHNHIIGQIHNAMTLN